jgi:hypothetical protein
VSLLFGSQTDEQTQRRIAMKAIAIVLGLFVMLAVRNPIRGGEPNPGLKAVADSSTDIVVAEVLDTKPCKAIEGARDTAQLKVIRALKGPSLPGPTPPHASDDDHVPPRSGRFKVIRTRVFRLDVSRIVGRIWSSHHE